MDWVDVGAKALNLASALGGGKVRRDIPYGEHPRHRLDLYLPRRPAASAPIMLFFYGGGWVKGSRDMYAFVGRALADNGICAVMPDYRLGQPASKAVEDGVLALHWVTQNRAGPVFVAGHSAGAHIAASMAYGRAFSRAKLAGFLGLAGPYQYLAGATPAFTPPAFIATAGRDRLIPGSVAQRFAERLRSAGVGVETRDYPGATHATLVGALSPLLRSVGPVLQDMTAFVERVVAQPSVTP